MYCKSYYLFYFGYYYLSQFLTQNCAKFLKIRLLGFIYVQSIYFNYCKSIHLRITIYTWPVIQLFYNVHLLLFAGYELHDRFRTFKFYKRILFLYIRNAPQCKKF